MREKEREARCVAKVEQENETKRTKKLFQLDSTLNLPYFTNLSHPSHPLSALILISLKLILYSRQFQEQVYQNIVCDFLPDIARQSIFFISNKNTFKSHTANMATFIILRQPVTILVTLLTPTI